ncbi:Phosphoribosylformylglycinamidine synthase subunit PurL [Bienertia sinuspersici]
MINAFLFQKSVLRFIKNVFVKIFGKKRVLGSVKSLFVSKISFYWEFKKFFLYKK